MGDCVAMILHLFQFSFFKGISYIKFADSDFAMRGIIECNEILHNKYEIIAER